MITNSKLRSRKLTAAAWLIFLASGLFKGTAAIAQTKTIEFESGTWEEIKAKSSKENKLIFLDAYASWCGVCKKMQKNVFTNDSVADYFNANFINAKIDMESGEGIGLSKQYNVSVYPTLLFINAQGKEIRRAVGGLQAGEFIDLARDAQNPNKQISDRTESYELDNADGEESDPNKIEVGFNVSQFQNDFAIGLQVISPYFMRKSVALKAGTNLLWFENFDGTETTLTSYHNFQLGMRGRNIGVTHHVAAYGEGGVLFILPGSDFSSQSLVVGGYGLIGFEFRIVPGFAYFLEFGAVGSGAKADKIAGKPVYSTGFLTNVGFKLAF